MLGYVLVLGLVTMVFGEGCCPPDAWEGVADLLTTTVGQVKSHHTKGIIKLHLNNTFGMIAMEEDIIFDGQEVKMKVIQDYHKETEYIIWNWTCRKRMLEFKIPRCIPENATVVQDTYFGTGSEQVAVKTYTFMISGLEVYFTVTASDCVPMALFALMPNVGMEMVEFTGITTGVKDPTVFDIPPYCQNSDTSIGYVPLMSRLGRYVFPF